jgi:hypothetical protein
VIEDELASFGETEAELEVATFPEYTEIKRKLQEGKNKLEGLRTAPRVEVNPDIRNFPQYSELLREVQERERRLAALRCCARCRIHQLLADAFGVYTLGPCYAASLIVLRLCPISPDTDERRAPDADRAALVLEVLGKMNGNARGPYVEYIDKVSEIWKGMVARSGASPLIESRRQNLVQLATRLWDEFDRGLPTPRYYTSSRYSGGGWNHARKWCEVWADHANEAELPPLELTWRSRLRDVLNAAWLFRLLADYKELEPATKATREVCDRILSLRKEQEELERAERGNRIRGSNPPMIQTGSVR